MLPPLEISERNAWREGGGLPFKAQKGERSPQLWHLGHPPHLLRFQLTLRLTRGQTMQSKHRHHRSFTGPWSPELCH